MSVTTVGLLNSRKVLPWADRQDEHVCQTETIQVGYMTDDRHLCQVLGH